MTRKLYVGDVDPEIPRSGCLYICDEIPEEKRKLSEWRLFDPAQHHFNALKDITEQKALELSDVLYAATPGGSDTLTVKYGRQELAEALMRAHRLDMVSSDNEDVQLMLRRLLFVPVVRKALCTKGKEFSFNKRTVIFARLNRREIGEHAAFIIGIFLIGHYQGQVVVRDAGFYLRDVHGYLLREDRLIAQVDILENVSKQLRKNLLLIKEKIAKHAIVEDAETLARYSGLVAGTNEYNDFIGAAIA